MLENIEVILRRVKWHQAPDWSDTGMPFLIGIGMLTNTTGEVTFKGDMLKPSINERYRLWGEWQDEPKYGGQSFRFYSFEILVNSTVKGLASYLERYVDGLGDVRSHQIVAHFGSENCLKILRETPERVQEIDGIGPATVKEIRRHFEEDICAIDPAAYAAVYNLIAEYSPPKRIVTDILYDFKSSASQMIRDNPYLLLNYSGLGWDKVDKIAIKKVKYDPKGLERHKAAIMEMLVRIGNEGDTYAELIDFRCRCSKSLKVIPSQEAIDALIEDNLVILDTVTDAKGKEKQAIALANLYNAEQEIAWRLRGLEESFTDKPIQIDTTGLEDEQIEACKFIAEHPVCLLVGPPGTGKTVSICKTVETFKKLGHEIVFTTPTGKAAKRADEVLRQWIPNHGIQVSTIHRALEPLPSGGILGVPEEHAKFNRGREKFIFSRNENYPLTADIAINDETSMEDAELMAKHLRPIMPGSRVIFVGDENQLPSVGAGACLRDMIEGGIPTFSLLKPRRNSGAIVLACHAIRAGNTPIPPAVYNPPLDNWIHIEESDPNKIAKIIVDLHDETDRDPKWNLQVISPQNDNLPIACVNLNKLLSAKLNPARQRWEGNEESGAEAKYGPGDKIVRKKNGFVDLMEEFDDADLSDFDDFGSSREFYWNKKNHILTKTYIVNGDIGEVVDIGKYDGKKWVIVAFKNPDRLCRLPAGDAHIQLAYCVTCHVAQGSGFPIVIFPVHNSFYWNERDKTGLWNRELLYTMFSRGIDGVITVGNHSAIAAAVSRKTIHKRKTFLAKFIKESRHEVLR